MTLEDMLDQSDGMVGEILRIIDLPLYGGGARIKVSALLCSLSFEHADGARALLHDALLPSALVIHRSQFECLLRSIWTLYGANEMHLEKLSAELTLDSEQAAKNLPSTSEMMNVLERKAPVAAVAPLREFVDYNWKALNSYVHAGIHPLRRHEHGYPAQLAIDAMMNINGLTVMAAMQFAILTGVPNLQRKVLATAARFPAVLRSRLG